MRILVLEDELSPRGGQELSLLSVCESLSRRGHEIILLYKKTGTLAARYGKFCRSMTLVKAYSIDHKHPFASAAAFLSALRAARAARPDLIYANQYQDSLFAGCASRLNRVPFVCHLRIPAPDRFGSQNYWGLSAAARVIVISESMRRDWQRHTMLGSKIELIMNGIDPTEYEFSSDPRPARRRLGLDESARLILYAGRVHAVKGIDALLEAFDRIRKKKPAVVLVIAGRERGEPGYVDKLKRSAETKGFDGSIRWIEHSDEMSSLYAAADLTILPSVWPEPFGRTLIESMACGTPAIGSRVGGIPEVLTGEFDRFLFPVNDASALAELLERAIDWRAADPALGQRAREHVNRYFNLSRTVDQIEALFKKLKERRS